jgi:hypothetical protein
MTLWTLFFSGITWTLEAPAGGLFLVGIEQLSAAGAGTDSPSTEIIWNNSSQVGLS